MENQDNELMNWVKTVHICFVEASEAACEALGLLLDAIDKGEMPDHQIEKRYGKRILETFLEAERAYRDLETYF